MARDRVSIETVRIAAGKRTYTWSIGGDPSDLDTAISYLQGQRDALAREPQKPIETGDDV